jgi:hypothetical protein
LISSETGEIKITAPKFVTIRSDKQKEVNIYEYVNREHLFDIKTEKNILKIGEECDLTINLKKDLDPAEYYAIIAVPSVLSIRQTDDLLSDYKGQLIYGQRTGGGEKIQLLTLPFRGSRTITIKNEAAYKGFSSGYVFVRHINNPEIISTIKTDKITVK